jgi:isoamylase
MFNAYWEPLIFELPHLEHQPWRRWIDTSRDAPDDVSEWSLAASVSGPTCAVQPRSLVILFAEGGGATR